MKERMRRLVFVVCPAEMIDGLEQDVVGLYIPLLQVRLSFLHPGASLEGVHLHPA
jgi:hypothetical protein